MMKRRSRFCDFVFIALTLLLFGNTSNAQVATFSLVSDSKLLLFVNDRWLFGNPSRMFDEFEMAISLMPIKGYELMQKKMASQELKVQLIDGLKAKQKEMRVPSLTQPEKQAQFDLWGKCLVAAYRAKLEPQKISELQRYVDLGIFKWFPPINKSVEEWLFTALRRQSGDGKALYTDATVRALERDEVLFQQMKRRLGAFFVTTNSLANLLQIQAAFGYVTYQAVLGELMFMSSDLPKIAMTQGVNEQQWQAIEDYGSSNIAVTEDVLYRECLQNEAFLTQPLRTWSVATVSAMKSFFEENPALLRK
jgi:hypothetical protein